MLLVQRVIVLLAKEVCPTCTVNSTLTKVSTMQVIRELIKPPNSKWTQLFGGDVNLGRLSITAAEFRQLVPKQEMQVLPGCTLDATSVLSWRLTVPVCMDKSNRLCCRGGLDKVSPL